MDKKLFDKCLSAIKSRIRKLTMDKNDIQIAIDNYKRDYEKALKQLMKLHGLDGEFTFDPNPYSTFGKMSRTGSLVIRETDDMFVPYRLQFVSTKKNTFNRPELVYEFEGESIEDIEKMFTENILSHVVKGECAA